MTPIDERKEANITSAENTTRVDSIKNFMVQGKFKNTVYKEPKRNPMTHLKPKKKKRKK